MFLRKTILRGQQSSYSQLLAHIRSISYDKLSNKRITRLETDIQLESKEYKSKLINRNPRNLEQLSFENKPTGFWLDRSPATSWNRLVLEQNGRHLNAYLAHWSGRKLVEASTNEPNLKRYFKSTNSSQAAKTLAQIIARRCLQSGYLCVGVDEFMDEQETGMKRRAFFSSVEANGITLQEPPEIVHRSPSDL